MSTGKQNEVSQIKPRSVANKASPKSLFRAIRMALAVESDAVRRNTQSFNTNRYTAISEIEDYDQLKDRARSIKEQAIENLPQLLDQLKNAVEARGGHFFLARDAAEANEYIKNVCQQHAAKLVVKAKSITSEEIGLNPVLEQAGIEVAETDLAEFILQISDEQPSHIVAPAIHRSRERISELFKQYFDTDLPLETGEDLTKFARDILRTKFLTADVGISGANQVIADRGSLHLVESEGNIRMVTQAPSVHIAIAGVEKVIPSRKELIPFLELLPASGTGQPLTSYTNILTPPLNIPPFSFDGRARKAREFHLVLLDNGRMKMRADPDLREALYCIRCSACMNVCANFQAVGGHAFGGETYTGGIGGAWDAGTSGNIENARFSELCSSCSRCVTQCPVRIDINWLNSVLRNRLNKLHHKAAPLQKQVFSNFANSAKLGTFFVPVSNWVLQQHLSRFMLEKIAGVDRRRILPEFPAKTWTQQFRRRSKNEGRGRSIQSPVKVVFFADSFTNFNSPHVGMAAIRVFEKLGIDVMLSESFPAGRAAQSQGMIELAKSRAAKVARYMEQFVNDERDIIVVEPSVLALFRRDFLHLIIDANRYQKLNQRSFDPVEYLITFLKKTNRNIADIFKLDSLSERKLFYHGQCQQKSINAYQPTVDFLKAVGFDVVTSTVECCGMAGSFGYKKHFYEVSRRVADDLVGQINQAERESGARLLVASGMSCRKQLELETGRTVLHPLELLEKFMTG